MMQRKNDMPVLGLAGCHDEKLENCRYVFTGTLQRLRWPLTAMFPSGSIYIYPLLDYGKYQGRSFTSIQMFHTHAPLPGI